MESRVQVSDWNVGCSLRFWNLTRRESNRDFARVSPVFEVIRIVHRHNYQRSRFVLATGLPVGPDRFIRRDGDNSTE